MQNIDETIIGIKKYLQKLLIFIQTEEIFSLGEIKLLKKNRVDDLICCIETFLPNEYKNFNPKQIKKKLSSLQVWHELYNAIKTKVFFSNDLYMINTNEIIRMIHVIQKTIDADIKKLYS